MLLCKLYLLSLFFTVLPYGIMAQGITSAIYKNRDYGNAVSWLKKNQYIYDSLTAYDVPPREAVAIVFPELMRYSALEDKMEVTGLMVLYTRLGKEYADFSVGHFQMKPTFVQHIETDARIYLSNKEIQRICPFLLDGDDTPDNRKQRVSSLTFTNNEVSYLALFYKICLKKFNHIHFKNESDKIRFLATAYNCGYHHSTTTLYHLMKKRQFPVYNSLLIDHVNYANLSLAWWNKNH